MNKVILIGNLGKDPEIRQSAKGVKICTVSIATQDGDKDENGNKKPSWHNLVSFDKTADIFEKYTKKGSKVCIEGRIKYDEYVSKSTKIPANIESEDLIKYEEYVKKYGYKVTSTSIIVYHVELLDKKETSTDLTTVFHKEEQFNSDPF